MMGHHLGMQQRQATRWTNAEMCIESRLSYYFVWPRIVCGLTGGDLHLSIIITAEWAAFLSSVRWLVGRLVS